ncbi:MAG: hypothetical protein OEM49_10075 [Myxococcales bacterium]|nr:hypothetical protein [Myxococcales bacterium]MDH5307796.1 hypothetical protein [Myxococcales bacterium]MDH5566452.1 hypothetical protein [Myxococcales bacterium]
MRQDLRAQKFHDFRRTAVINDPSVLRRLWKWHDDHPLPTALNLWVRNWLVFPARAFSEHLKHRKDIALKVGSPDSAGDPAVPDDTLLEIRHRPGTVTLAEAEAKLRLIEGANALLVRADRGWIAQPRANYAYKGISIEEMGCRFLGYFYAYQATGNEEWRDKARYCIELLQRRMLPGGHIVLQGHLVIDFTYALAAYCLFLWSSFVDDRKIEEQALNVASILLRYQISGSQNHGIIPCYALAESYRRTGDSAFLAAASRRVRRTALRNQLASGGWIDHDSWIWYHSIITGALCKTYSILPCDLEHMRFKDRVARCLYRAINRIIASQREDGSLRHGRGEARWNGVDESGVSPDTQVVHYDAKTMRFTPADSVREFPTHAWECFAMQILIDDIDLYHLAPLIRGYVGFVTRQNVYWRFEFHTMAAGIGMHLLKTLEDHPYTKNATIRADA